MQNSQKIFFRKLKMLCSIGIYEHERRNKQTILIDMDIFLSSNLRGGESDVITDTLNYDEIKQKIHALIESRHFNLQENLCEEIINICKEYKEIASIRVATQKPEAYDDCETVGYEVNRIFIG